MNPAGANASLTIDPGGPNQSALPLAMEPPPAWTRPGGIIVIPRSAPLTLGFTPGDTSAPTEILLYAYTAVYNATVEVLPCSARGDFLNRSGGRAVELRANVRPDRWIVRQPVHWHVGAEYSSFFHKRSGSQWNCLKFQLAGANGGIPMRLGLFLLLALRLSGQPANGTDFIDMGGDVIPSYESTSGGLVLSYTTQYSWSITRAANGDKVFTFSAKVCTYFTSVQTFPGNYLWVALPAPICGPLSQSAAEALGPISAALTEFNDYHPNAPHLPPVYQPSLEPGTPVVALSKPVSPKLATVQPAVQPNPQMIFLDGLGNTANAFDLTTNTIVSQVTVPSTTGPLGIRPVSTGQQNEIWVANGGLEVTVVDLAGQKVVTNILTPSIPRASTVAAIAFTNDGGTAFEAVGFSSPDSSGNNGALLVFDAVNRVVTSTFPLKNAPTSLLKKSSETRHL
jgi:hypothetical protein